MTKSPAIAHLARAQAYLDAKDTAAPGHAQAALRERIILGPVSQDAQRSAGETARRIMALGIADMPPATEDVALLLDTLAMRRGLTKRADAWARIGIKQTRGKEFMSRNWRAVDWPIWKTLRDAALS